MTPGLLTHPAQGWMKLWGTIAGSDGATVTVLGLDGLARLGDLIRIDAAPSARMGEVIAVRPEGITVLLMGHADGITAGQRAWLQGPLTPHPDDSWLGQVVDALGRDAKGTALAQGRVARQSRPNGPRRGLPMKRPRR